MPRVSVSLPRRGCKQMRKPRAFMKMGTMADTYDPMSGFCQRDHRAIIHRHLKEVEAGISAVDSIVCGGVI